MKLTFYQLFLITSLFINSFANSTKGQGILNQNLSIHVNNKNVKEVLQLIEKRSNVSFVYSSSLIDGGRKVTLSLASSTVGEVLDKLLVPLQLRYEVSGRHIVLDKVDLKAFGTFPEEKEVELVADITIAGKVTDESGSPLPGVSILVKGTQTGTITNEKGDFKLSVQDKSVTLVFSFVGYNTVEKVLGNQLAVNVQLIPADKSLQEVVVIGYGTQKKSDLTGAVSALNNDEFNVGPQMATQQLIQGKISGVNISKNSGKPGGSNTIRIRGGTSISASNEPLYVIDGVPIAGGEGQANISTGNTNFFDQEAVNPLITLNPNDIASVIVLKDASATAIYGSRGANGVIMITTKKGREGKAQVTYDMMAGVSEAANYLDVLSADEYRSVVKSLNLPLDDKGYSTNWQKEIYRKAYNHSHYISMSGGGKSTTYRASVGYGDQQGIMLGSDLKQTNARININHEAMEGKLKLDFRLNYGENFGTQSPISNTVGSELGSSLNYESYVFNPTYPKLGTDGKYVHIPPFRVNPASFQDELLDERTNRRLLSNLTAGYNIFKTLAFKVNLGYTRQSTDRNSFISGNNPLGSGMGGFTNVQKLADFSKLLETTLSYNKSFGIHNIDAVAGYSYQYFKGESLNTAANGFLSPSFKWYSLQAASTISNVSSGFGSSTLVSFYGRVNYNFDNRYLFTATVRQDGSSRFGAGKKWGVFPSAAVSWRISQEKFFKFEPISDLKLRVSYGITGNQEIGNLNSITTLGASTAGYLVGNNRVTIVLPQQYANPDLQWEQTGQFNVGINFGLWKQRVYASIDYYDKVTSDLLLQIAVPSPSVVNTQLANVGSVQNKGIEIELGADVLRGKKLGWNASFNLSRNRNEVLSLSNEKWQGKDIQTAPAQGQGLSGIYSQLITPGYPIGAFYGKKFIGIENGVEVFEKTNQFIGSAQPNFIFGLSNNLSYNNWSLQMNFRGSVGNDVYNMTANNLGYLSNLPGRNVFKVAETSGVKRDQPKQYSSRWIEDGSFVRLDNLTLSYAIPTSNTFLSSAKVYVTGQNLLLLTKYSGLDPEVNSEITRTAGVTPLGIDYLSYPKAKSLSIGASFTF